MSISHLELRLGMFVVGSDGDHIGQVKEVRASDFLVDREFDRDVYVPFDAIQCIVLDDHPAAHHVALNIEASRADEMGWPEPALVGGP